MQGFTRPELYFFLFGDEVLKRGLPHAAPALSLLLSNRAAGRPSEPGLVVDARW